MKETMFGMTFELVQDSSFMREFVGYHLPRRLRPGHAVAMERTVDEVVARAQARVDDMVMRELFGR